MNTFSAMTFFRLALWILLSGTALPLAVWRNNRLGHIIGAASSIVGSLFGLTASLAVLFGQHMGEYRYTLPPFLLRR
jgi:hypothetical protein